MTVLPLARRLAVAGVCAVAALGLVACGDDEPPTEQELIEQASTEVQQSVEATISDGLDGQIGE